MSFGVYTTLGELLYGDLKWDGEFIREVDASRTIFRITITGNNFLVAVDLDAKKGSARTERRIIVSRGDSLDDVIEGFGDAVKRLKKEGYNIALHEEGTTLDAILKFNTIEPVSIQEQILEEVAGSIVSRESTIIKSSDFIRSLSLVKLLLQVFHPYLHAGFDFEISRGTNRIDLSILPDPKDPCVDLDDGIIFKEGYRKYYEFYNKVKQRRATASNRRELKDKIEKEMYEQKFKTDEYTKKVDLFLYRQDPISYLRMVADSNSKFIVEAINQIGRFEKSNLPRIDDECALKLVNSAIRDVNEYGEKFLYKLYRQLTDNYKLNLINDLRKNKPTIGYPPLKEQLILDYVETLSLYDDYFNNLYESLSRNERRKILSKIKYEKILQGKLPHLTLKILDDALKEGEINPEELRKMKFLNNYRLIHSAIKDFKKPKAIEEDSSQVYNERSKTSGKSKSSIKTSTAKPTKTKNMRKRAKNLKNRETHVELVWVDKLSTPLKNSFQGIKKKDIIITILVSAVIFLTQIGHLWMELLMDELGLFGPELSYVYIYFYWPAFILIFPIIVTLFYGKWNGRILLSFLVGLTPTLLSVIIEELSLLHCSPGFIGLGLFCAGSALQVRDRKKGLILLLSGLGLWVYAFHTGIINWSIDIWPLTSGGEGYLAH